MRIGHPDSNAPSLVREHDMVINNWQSLLLPTWLLLSLALEILKGLFSPRPLLRIKFPSQTFSCEFSVENDALSHSNPLLSELYK